LEVGRLKWQLKFLDETTINGTPFCSYASSKPFGVSGTSGMLALGEDNMEKHAQIPIEIYSNNNKNNNNTS